MEVLEACVQFLLVVLPKFLVWLSWFLNLGPTMVMKFWYEKEISRLLSDEMYYEKVNAVPFAEMRSKLITINFWKDMVFLLERKVKNLHTPIF